MKKNYLTLITLLLLGNVQARQFTLPVLLPVNGLVQNFIRTTEAVFPFQNVGKASTKALAQVLHFEVKIINKNVQLSWATDSNEEIKSFEIERADDGQTYKVVGGRLAKFVMGNAMYEFVDALPKKNIELLYRIKVINKYGDHIYSSIKPISIDEGRLFFKLKENPIQASIKLEVIYATARNLQVTIYTIGGQKVQTLTTRINAGVNLLSIPAQNLLAGIYRLALETGGERKVFSFVKE